MNLAPLPVFSLSQLNLIQRHRSGPDSGMQVLGVDRTVWRVLVATGKCEGKFRKLQQKKAIFSYPPGSMSHVLFKKIYLHVYIV